jgi:PKD domain/Gametolysin peptidase M11
MALLLVLSQGPGPQSTPSPAKEPSGRGSGSSIQSRSISANAIPGSANGPKSKPERGERWDIPHSRPAFGRFASWCDRFRVEERSEIRKSLEAEGVKLAQERRQEMLELIPSDAEAALKLSIPRDVRGRIPASVAALTEEPVSGRGDFGVIAAVGIPGGEVPRVPVYRTVSVGDRAWRAYTFGDALDRITASDVPVHGIALDGVFALDPNPVRRLEPGESAAAAAVNPDALCSISGAAASALGTGTAVDTGGEVAWVCGTTHLAELNAKQRLAMLDQGNGQDADGAFRMKSAYTEGIKRLLIIRVDFSDLAGAPLTDVAGTNMAAGIDSFYREQSFGKTGFRKLGDGSAMTATLRMPKTAATYGASDASVLRTDARNAARAAGINLAGFDFDLTCFGAVPGFNWAGLGYVGAPGAWIRAAFDAAGGVPSHELGHNFGLNHANFWDTGGQSVTGAGSNVEYGDSFDTMGNAAAGKRHFNARYKNFLDWMPNTQVRGVVASGTYRVWAHDQTNTATYRALRIPKNSQTNYWLEFRQQFTDRPFLMSGLGLRWARTGNQSALLLDTTPGTADGKNDSALLVGRTFSDTAAGIHITPIGKGGTVPESLDVVVNIGRFTNNQPPTVSLAVPTTNTAPNAALAFAATTSDPDGDVPAFSWDFGDGTVLPLNTNRVSHAWTAAGEYVVRCTASDMKGGVASRSLVVRVGSPSTVRIAGRITRDGQPVQGIRVEVSNTRQAYTDSDGTYVIAGLARASYTVKAVAEGLLFTRSGFTNPLSVQANRTGIDFEAALPGDLANVALVPLGAQWRYYDRGNLAGLGWRQPSFSDAEWVSGAAPLGYGDDNIVTTVSFGGVATNKFITTWFRHTFVVDDPSGFQSVTLGLIRDDGAAVFLNGREVFRSNLPAGTLTPATRASANVAGADETAVFETDLDPALILRGTNVLAVEVHQDLPTSSDLRFALQISALLRPTATVPRLAFGAAADRIRLAWPLTAVGYTLQEADSPAAGWHGSDEAIGAEAGQNFTTIPATNSARFFRLIHL